ncbi:MAG: hypothetical protein ABI220_04215 [Candidatus Saccharimonadales bacterium]
MPKATVAKKSVRKKVPIKPTSKAATKRPTGSKTRSKESALLLQLIVVWLVLIFVFLAQVLYVYT